MDKIRSLAAVLALSCLVPTIAGAADLSWTSVSSGTGGLDINYTALVHGGGRFVAVGQDPAGKPAIAESQDGLTWTGVFAGTAAGKIDNVAYGKGNYLAIGSTLSFTSTDGIDWKAGAAVPGGANSELVYGNGVFVVFAGCPTRCTALSSSDGHSWNSQLMPAGLTDAFGYTSLGYDGTRFVSIGQFTSGDPDEDGTGKAPVYTSCDGSSWTHSADVKSEAGISFFGVQALGPGLIALGIERCVGDIPSECAGAPSVFGPVIATGTNTTDLPVTVLNDPEFSEIGDIAFAGNLYYATGTTFSSALISSPDAIHWSDVSGLPATFTPTTLATDSDHIVAAGDDGEIFAASVSGGGSTPTGGTCTELPAVGSSSGSFDLLTLMGLFSLLVIRRRA